MRYFIVFLKNNVNVNLNFGGNRCLFKLRTHNPETLKFILK